MSPRARRPTAFSLRDLAGPDRPPTGPAPPPIEDLLDDFVARWRTGERPRVEEYLDRVDDDGAIDLISKEYWVRATLDGRPDPREFLVRFPHLADRLRVLLAIHQAAAVAEGESAPPALQPGDALGPYRLIRELGRGQYARVFLAAQTDLEDRLVVVKISRRPSLEPRLLAKAQHRHVVEVLAAGKTRDDQFHWVCLPFLGGATLADILAEWRARKAQPSSGRDLLDLLDAVAAPEYPPLQLSRAARELIRGGSHAQAIAWMVARLAEALDHGFRRGITHEDVKPSNILVTADGDPMLLDLSLGLGLQPLDDGDPGERGSLHYMSPERLRAFVHGRGGRPPRPIDNHRADIYSLGLVLAESISGRSPVRECVHRDLPWKLAEELAADRQSEASLRRRLKDVPLGLRPILARCLAVDPSDRYRAAIHLAEDLDRWRTDRPLIHCGSRSGTLPLFRWARKRKAALAGAALFLSAGLIGSFAALRIRDGSEAQAAWLKAGRIWERADLFGLRYTLPGRWTPIEPDDPVVLARRRLDEYDALGQGDWRDRDDVRALDGPAREDLDAWIQEQALRLARGLEQRSGSRSDRVRALNSLEKVAAGGAAEPVHRQIQALRTALDLPSGPPSGKPGSPPWIGAYLLGVEAEIDRPREATRHYQEALAMNPQSWWSRLRLSLVQIRLGDYPEAAKHLERCLDRYPNSAGLRLELATCLLLQGRLAEALEQDNRAVELDPDLAMAYHNRQLIRALLGQSAANREDRGRFEALTQFRHGSLARNLQLELADYSQARGPLAGTTATIPDYLEQRLQATPDDVGLLVRAASHRRRIGDFARARSDLDRVLEIEPANLLALYHRGLARLGLGDTSGRADLDRVRNDPRLEELLARNPETTDLFLFIALAETTAQHTDRAIDAAMQGLSMAEKSGQVYTQGLLCYVAAMSWVQEYYADEQNAEHLDLAAHHLGRAMELVPDLEQAFAIDPYFDTVRRDLDERLTVVRADR